jgi:hypothetical protein
MCGSLSNSVVFPVSVLVVKTRSTPFSRPATAYTSIPLFISRHDCTIALDTRSPSLVRVVIIPILFESTIANKSSNFSFNGVSLSKFFTHTHVNPTFTPTDRGIKVPLPYTDRQVYPLGSENPMKPFCKDITVSVVMVGFVLEIYRFVEM